MSFRLFLRRYALNAGKRACPAFLRPERRRRRGGGAISRVMLLFFARPSVLKVGFFGFASGCPHIQPDLGA